MESSSRRHKSTSPSSSGKSSDWVRMGYDQPKWFRISSLASNPHFSPTVDLDELDKRTLGQLEYLGYCIMSDDNNMAASPLKTVKNVDTNGNSPVRQDLKRKFDFAALISKDEGTPAKIRKMLSPKSSFVKPGPMSSKQTPAKQRMSPKSSPVRPKSSPVRLKMSPVAAAKSVPSQRNQRNLFDLISQVSQRVVPTSMAEIDSDKDKEEEEDESEEEEEEDEEEEDNSDVSSEEESDDDDDDDDDDEEEDEDDSDENDENVESDEVGSSKNKSADDNNKENACDDVKVEVDEEIDELLMEGADEEVLPMDDEELDIVETESQPSTSYAKAPQPPRSSSPLGFPDTELITKMKAKGKTASAFMSTELDKFLEGNKSVKQDLAEKIVPAPQNTVGQPDLDIIDQISILSFQTRQGIHEHIAAHEANECRDQQMAEKLEERELEKRRQKYLRAVSAEPFLRGLDLQSHHSSRDSYQWRRKKKSLSPPQQRTLAKSLNIVAEQEDQPTKGKIYGWRNDGKFASKRKVKNAIKKDPSPKMKSRRDSGRSGGECEFDIQPRRYVEKEPSELKPDQITPVMAEFALGALRSWDQMDEYVLNAKRWCGRHECRTRCVCQQIHLAEVPVCPLPLPPATDTSCDKDYCRLGCVCSGLKYKRKEEHCGEVACMFGCECHTRGIIKRSDRSARRTLNTRYGNDAIFNYDDILFEQMVELDQNEQDELDDQDEVDIESISDAHSVVSSDYENLPPVRDPKPGKRTKRKRSKKYGPHKKANSKPRPKPAPTGREVVYSSSSGRPLSNYPPPMPSGNMPNKPLKFSSHAGSSKSTVRKGQPMVTAANYETVKELWMNLGGGSAGVPLEEADEDMLLKLMPMTRKNKQVMSVKGKEGRLEKQVVHSLHTGHVEKVLEVEDGGAGDIQRFLEAAAPNFNSHQHCARTTIYAPVRKNLRCQCVNKPGAPLPPPKAESEPETPTAPDPKTGPPQHMGPMAKFRIQMVLVQRKKLPDQPAPPKNAVPHLLEVQSNCEWGAYRSEILAKISAIAGDGNSYPTPRAFKAGPLEIMILTKAEKPTTIPPHLRSVLKTDMMFPIRIRITLVNFDPAPVSTVAPAPPVSAPAPVSAPGSVMSAPERAIPSPPMFTGGISSLSNLQVNMKAKPLEMSQQGRTMMIQGGSKSPRLSSSPLPPFVSVPLSVATSLAASVGVPIAGKSPKAIVSSLEAQIAASVNASVASASVSSASVASVTSVASTSEASASVASASATSVSEASEASASTSETIASGASALVASTSVTSASPQPKLSTSSSPQASTSTSPPQQPQELSSASPQQPPPPPPLTPKPQTPKAGTQDEPIEIDENDDEPTPPPASKSPQKPPTPQKGETVQVILLSDGRQMILKGNPGSKIGPQTLTAIKLLAANPNIQGTKVIGASNKDLSGKAIQIKSIRQSTIASPGATLFPASAPDAGKKLSPIKRNTPMTVLTTGANAKMLKVGPQKLIPGAYFIPSRNTNGAPTLIPIQGGKQIVMPMGAAKSLLKTPEVKEEKPEQPKVNITEPIEILSDDDDKPVAPVVIQPEDPKSPVDEPEKATEKSNEEFSKGDAENEENAEKSNDTEAEISLGTEAMEDKKEDTETSGADTRRTEEAIDTSQSDTEASQDTASSEIDGEANKADTDVLQEVMNISTSDTEQSSANEGIVAQEAPASSTVASNQPLTIEPDTPDHSLETRTEPTGSFSTHPGPEPTVIEIPEASDSTPQPTVVSIEPEDCKSENGEEPTRSENNVIAIEDEPERSEHNAISIEDEPERTRRNVISVEPEDEDGDKEVRNENNVISVEPETSPSTSPDMSTVRKTLFSSSSPQAVSMNETIPEPSLRNILVSSPAPAPSPAPPAPPAPLAAAKAKLQSILKAQAKKFQAPPPPPPPPPPQPLPPTLTLAPVSTAPSGPPMTALALLKARKAGLNVSAPMSTYVSTVVPTPPVTTHVSTPVTSLVTTPSPMSTPQSSPKKRSRKDVLVNRNLNAPNSATSSASPLLEPKKEIKEEEEEEVDIETVPVEVINVDESDDDDPVEILRVEYKKVTQCTDSSSCNIHAVGLLHGLKTKKRKQMAEVQDRDETMEFQEQVLMVEKYKEEQEEADVIGRDRHTHMARESSACYRERARRCDLSFKFEALRLTVMPDNPRAAKIEILGEAARVCKMEQKRHAKLLKERQKQVERRAALIQKYLYLKGAVESESAEHCIIDETTGRKISIDDDSVLNMPENNDDEEEEEEEEEEPEKAQETEVKQEPEDDFIDTTALEILDKDKPPNRDPRIMKPKRRPRNRRKKSDGPQAPKTKRVRQRKRKRLQDLEEQDEEEDVYERRRQQMEDLVTSSSVYVDVDNEEPRLFPDEDGQNDPNFAGMMEICEDYDDMNPGFQMKADLSGPDKEYVPVQDDELYAALTGDVNVALPPPIEGVEDIFK